MTLKKIWKKKYADRNPRVRNIKKVIYSSLGWDVRPLRTSTLYLMYEGFLCRDPMVWQSQLWKLIIQSNLLNFVKSIKLNHYPELPTKTGKVKARPSNSNLTIFFNIFGYFRKPSLVLSEHARSQIINTCFLLFWAFFSKYSQTISLITCSKGMPGINIYCSYNICKVDKKRKPNIISAPSPD